MAISTRSQMGQFAMVPVWVMSMDLTPNEFRIYTAIRSFSNMAGTCWPRMRTISDRARCSIKAVQNAVQKFRRLGLVSTVKIFNKDNDGLDRLEYHLADLDPREWDVRPRTKTPATCRDGGVPHTGERVSPAQGTHKQTNEQTKKTPPPYPPRSTHHYAHARAKAGGGKINKKENEKPPPTTPLRATQSRQHGTLQMNSPPWPQECQS